MDRNGLGQVQLDTVAPGSKYAFCKTKDEFVLHQNGGMSGADEAAAEPDGPIPEEIASTEWRSLERFAEILIDRRHQPGLDRIRNDRIPVLEKAIRPGLDVLRNYWRACKLGGHVGS
jgi:hypothetical protein